MSAYRENCKPEEKKKKFNFWRILMPIVRLLKLIFYPVFLLGCGVEYVVGPMFALLIGYLFYGDRLYFFEETGVWFMDDARLTYDELFFLKRRSHVHDDETYPNACFVTSYRSFFSNVDWFKLFEDKIEKPTEE